MLSRRLQRALLDSRWPIPPPYLLPWAANLTTAAHTSDEIANPPPMPKRLDVNSQTTGKAQITPRETPLPAPSPSSSSHAAQPALPSPNSPTSSTATPLDLSPSLRQLLPLLKAQSPHYITVHIHGKPYLLTQGDTVRLPFLMHGVEPGDVLRLNRAINIGSRDYTLKASAPPARIKSPTTDTGRVLDLTTGEWASYSRVMPPPLSPSASSSSAPESEEAVITPASQHVRYAPHFIPHIAKGKHSYIDERLFVCRAVVMGVESEPLRIKEKTKRRQRKVKKVKSKHRFTVLKVREVRLRGVEELDGKDVGGEVD